MFSYANRELPSSTVVQLPVSFKRLRVTYANRNNEQNISSIIDEGEDHFVMAVVQNVLHIFFKWTKIHRNG